MMSFCFFKQKTAYDVRISDWSSDVCSSDLSHSISFPRLARRKAFPIHRQEREKGGHGLRRSWHWRLPERLRHWQGFARHPAVQDWTSTHPASDRKSTRLNSSH